MIIPDFSQCSVATCQQCEHEIDCQNYQCCENESCYGLEEAMPEFCNEDECDSIDEPTKAKNLARYLGMKDGVSASISSEVTRWASCIIEFVLNKRNTKNNKKAD